MKKSCLHIWMGCLFSLVFTYTQVQAQGVTVGTNNPPDASAVLDVQSTSQGFLPPRLTNAQRNAIVNPAIGLTIYNTDTDCIETYFPNSGWKTVQCDCSNLPNAQFVLPTAYTNQAATIQSTVPNMTYSWTFQNGSPATSNTQSTQVTWSAPGTYSVTLTLTDNAGCSASFTDVITVSACPAPGSQSTTFNYTGGVQTFVVPMTCVDSVFIEVWGAEGGQVGAGKGGKAQGKLNVTPGETLYVYVGQQGGGPGSGATFGGGGSAGSNDRGGGGGASDVRQGGTTLNQRVIVGGGGGGSNTGGTGGFGGGNSGGNGSDNNAFGGTQTNPGTGSCCPCPPPVFGVGQNGSCGGCNGSGGGGGWYGGGACTQGGGGSGYIGGVTGGSMTNGIRSGNGLVIITY